ncbi:MAG: ParB/RepB/Spo0J family partition protein [Pseudomonadota bacterium]
MAKRRRLTVPSADDLSQIEEEFRRETDAPDPFRTAPIAQVARDAAEGMEVLSPDDRAARAKDASDAELLRQYRDKDLILLDIPVFDIELDSMVRDRSVIDATALDELRVSIQKNGMRLPIEVYELDPTEGQGPSYGLLSGYRRLTILRELHAKLGDGHFDTARAILRTPAADEDRFAAMVEENEIRQQLSPYERGRIAAIAAKQGVFANTEAAVQAMFPAASKAKRSKIRSFAMIFEELGDILEFPENLREKDGLRIAGALRDGAEGLIRDALESVRATDPEAEWSIVQEVLQKIEASADRTARGGRPTARTRKSATTDWSGETLTLSNGIKLRKGTDGQGYTLQISGLKVTPEVLESVVSHVVALLEAPD